MKNTLLVFAILISSLITKADEGMWLPYLLKQMNEADMKKNGCKISAEDIYSVNKASLKDAIVQFGGGCTGEIISDKGLLLTNHHCGYSQIASHSTVEKDYLTEGFWAMNQQDELKCPGLTATFIIRIEDVTEKIKVGVNSSLSPYAADSVMRRNMFEIEAQARSGSHYQTFIRPFFYGNQYILFVTEVFKDVRMVGAPPSSIGKFGGDTDNWSWPRHTGDFSIFRIYAGADNNPADYSKDNKPYKPRQSLKISLKGVKENDFTFVYGFPGRTQEYLFSDAVEITMNESDPVKVNLREKRLAIMNKYMQGDDKIRIAYAAGYASLANYWKKWKGEMIGLRSTNAVEKKKEFEKKFLELVSTDPLEKEKFNKLFNEFHRIYDDYRVLNKQLDYLNEGLMGIQFFKYLGGLDLLFVDLKNKKSASPNNLKQNLDSYVKGTETFFTNYVYGMDKETFQQMFQAYHSGLEGGQMVPYVDSMIEAHDHNFANMTEWVFGNSKMILKENALMLLKDFEKNANEIASDPFYKLLSKINEYYNVKVKPKSAMYEVQLNELYSIYVDGLTKTYKDKKFYPDANSTLRVAYGKVAGFKPRDGMTYKYFTTLDGIIEKNDPLSDEFAVPNKTIQLYNKGDYGQYVDSDGKLHVAFIATNHTTGGNSGSPVLNAKGELIGTNFDRVWEGTMSDIMFNPEICRNISIDVRYTLWVIDKFAGAGYLLNEMTLVK